ncbi:hypothetical protein HU200_063048 [Digitaria exilis]|uniref:Uncharacterized protein n=1 Tax=Digitaria exilis TaxID=1010633 RepID=A0A835A4Q7_9POAL|nr:hypothetical protein HU200_063048 [Digitaria exilis]
MSFISLDPPPSHGRKGNIHKQEEDFAHFSLHKYWSSFIGWLFSASLLSICLCDFPYDSLRRVDIKI